MTAITIVVNSCDDSHLTCPRIGLSLQVYDTLSLPNLLLDSSLYLVHARVSFITCLPGCFSFHPLDCVYVSYLS